MHLFSSVAMSQWRKQAMKRAQSTNIFLLSSNTAVFSETDGWKEGDHRVKLPVGVAMGVAYLPFNAASFLQEGNYQLQSSGLRCRNNNDLSNAPASSHHCVAVC